MVQIKKTWETVYFTASKKGLEPVAVELSLNHETKKYTLCTAHEESVSFKDDTIEMSKLKLEALKEAIKYIEQYLAKR
jgi:hypothetical protein